MSNEYNASKNPFGNIILAHNPIWKVTHLTDVEQADKIVVFYGFHPQYHNKMDTLNDLFLQDPENVAFNDHRNGQPIFSKAELQDIRLKKTEVVFVESFIHIDDSIERIKLKLALAFSKQFSLEEMYLFARTMQTATTDSVYDSLTQKGQLPLSYDMIREFASNLRDSNTGKPFTLDLPADKGAYSYDELSSLRLEENGFVVDAPIGQQFALRTDIPFVTNPFQVSVPNPMLSDNARQKLTTLNSSLLLNAPAILNNTIYLCLAQDVLDKQEDNAKVTEDYMVGVYFPLLAEKSILSRDKLDAEHQQLIANTSTFLSKEDLKVFECVDLFFNLFAHSHTSKSSRSLDYKQSGIKSIKLTIMQTRSAIIPLEVIFKSLHATQKYPLIKCNMDNKQENIYRIYSNSVSTDGRKIPYLSLATVNAVSRDIAKKSSVSAYIEYVSAKNNNQTIYCTFEKNGNITVETTFDSVLTPEEVDALLVAHVNPIIYTLQTFFEQSGHHLDPYQTLQSPNIAIQHITYNATFGITKSFHIRDIIGCVSSVFNLEKDSSSQDGMVALRFKRVSNFNKVNSQMAFIADKFNDEDVLPKDIVEQLMFNFNMSEDNANRMVTQYINERQVELGANKNIAKKQLNPGFKSTLHINSVDDELSVVVENIDNVHYLYTVPIYVGSLVQLIQSNTDELFAKDVSRLCSGKSIENVGDIHIKDAVAVIPETFLPEEVETQVPLEDIIEEGIEEEVEEEEVQEPKKMELAKPEPITVPSALQPKSKAIFGLESDEEEESEEEEPKKEEPKPKVPEPKIPEPKAKEEPKKEEKKIAPIVPTLAAKPKKLFGFDDSGDEDEEESEEEESEEEQSRGGAKKVGKMVLKKNQADSDSDEEDEDDEDEELKEDEEEEDTSLRASVNTLHDISKLKLKSPNYFQKRLETRDTTLFKSIKEIKNDKFNKYSRICPSTARRQPVVLSKKELKHVIKMNPGTVPGRFNAEDKFVVDVDEDGVPKNDIVEYSTNPNNEYYYMCPQYWCLTKNIPLTQEQVDEGTICGGKDQIIPKDALTPGKHSIYHFFYKKEHEDANGKYIQHYPGFHKQKTDETKVPDPDKPGSYKTVGNYSIPCCFSLVHDKTKVLPSKEDYIKGPEQFPLPSGRWGFLPLAVSKLLHEANIRCNLTQGNIGNKGTQKCLLRCGVENSANQSFIACLASARFYNETIPSVRKMKDLIIESLTLDDFIKYQNGNLLANFEHDDPAFELDSPLYNDSKNPVMYVNYKESQLFTNMVKQKKSNKSKKQQGPQEEEADEGPRFLRKAVQSYLQFKRFLDDDDVYMDYTYLWDIVCEKNSKVFPHGANLIILELPDNDITNNIELICPTNQYSSETFNEHKSTIMLMMRNNIFEPIYLYSKVGTNVKILTTFTSKNPQMPAKERAMFFKIFKQLFEKCQPKNSLDKRVFEFSKPVLLDRLITRLQTLKFPILNQVLNYQGKVIGLVVQNQKKTLQGFVPCYPSALYSNIGGEPVGFVYMDENEKVWGNYADTLRLLALINYSTKKRTLLQKSHPLYLPVSPRFRVIDSGVVVGVLTESNQFIQIKDPYPQTELRSDDDLEALEDVMEDYVISSDDAPLLNNPNLDSVDTHTLHNQSLDKERIEYIRKIKLETNFFNIFRNAVRTFLNKNKGIRQQLERLINDRSLLYNTKLEEVVRMLQTQVQKNNIIQFEDFDYEAINQLIQSNISTRVNLSQEVGIWFDEELQKYGTCSSAPKDKCSQIQSSLCKPNPKQNGCSVILPKQNMLDARNNNEQMYFDKLADELIRYSRVNSFIFKPSTYLSFNQIEYKINEDEIILLESLIKDYYVGLVPAKQNPYAKNNTYDTAYPKKMLDALKYNSIDSIDELITPEQKITKECNRLKLPQISSLKWRLCFPSKFAELQFGSTVYCTFDVVLYILSKHVDENGKAIVNPNTNEPYKTPNELKDILFEEYTRMIEEFSRSQSSANVRESVRIMENRILNVFNEQGKQVLAKQVQEGSLSFEGLIGNAEYYLTNLDVWVLLSYFKVPSAFITKTDKKCMMESNFRQSVFVIYSASVDGTVNENEKMVYILSPSYTIHKDVRPVYKLVYHNNQVAFDLHMLKEGDCKTQVVDAIQHKTRVEDFLANYEKTKTGNAQCVTPEQGKEPKPKATRKRNKPQKLAAPAKGGRGARRTKKRTHNTK